MTDVVNKLALSSFSAIGFVGLGKMGLPMARLLTAQGCEVMGVDPSHVQRSEAQAAHVSASETADDLAAAKIVIFLVATADQLLSVLHSGPYADGRMAGTVAIVMSTVGPEALRAVESRATEIGVSLVDCPITGGVERAAVGKLTLFAAGPDSAVESVMPLLEIFGTTVRCGDHLGDGQSFKIVNNLLAVAHLAVAAEAIALGRRLGLNAQLLLEALPTGTADSWMLRDRGNRLVDREARRTPMTYLEIFAKDAALIAQTASDIGFEAPIANVTRDQWARATAMGLGKADDTAIMDVYEGP